MITRKQIEDRIVLLESDKAKLLANLNAYDGALQEARHWLSALEKEAEE